jgi:phage shock protein A
MDQITGPRKPWYKKSDIMIGGPIVAAIGIALFTFVGIHVLPFVLLAATNTLHLVVTLAALGGITFVALDKDIHTAAYYGWKSITRAIGYAIVNQDPIGVIETSIKTMKDKLAEMSQSKNDVGGQLKGLQAKIKENSARAEADMRKAQLAEKQGDTNTKTLMALEAQQLVTSNKNLTETKNKVELMFRVLEKMVSTVDFNIKKTSSELEIKKEERKVIMATHKAMVLGFKVIGGTGPDAEMFNRAMESIAETANRQLAEIDDIMDLSQGIIKGVDLEKGVMQEDAMKMLEKWEKEGSSALLGTDKAVLISQAYDLNQVIDVTPKKEATKVLAKGKGGKFDDLFKS